MEKEIITERFAEASNSLLLAMLDQSPDCIKILSSDGRLEYMNQNGQCAMEIDDFSAVAGSRWSELWPSDAENLIEDALAQAKEGEEAHFRSSCPTAKGSERWWDVSVSAFNSGEGSKGYISISRDVTAEVQDQNAAEAMAAEMRHRLGNVFTVVASLISSFARGDPDKESFAAEVVSRLSALAAAQSMRVANDGDNTLGDVVERLVRPYQSADATITISPLPEVSLDQGEIDALAMVLGELCVNSIKHGALGSRGSINISNGGGDRPRLIWTEQTKLEVEAHSRSGGQGLRLMRRIMQARGGEIEFQWEDHGLEVTISLAARG